MTAPIPQNGDSVLSVRQPFSFLIVQGMKTIENRSRPTRYRGRLYIHSSAGPQVLKGWHEIVSGPSVPLADSLTLDDGTELPALATLPRGVILGCVDLVDCQRYEDMPKRLQDDPFAEGPYCWLLENAQVLREPIADKGKLGIWKYATSNGLMFC